MSPPDHDRQKDIKAVAKILRDGNYSYQQSKHLIEQARKIVGLKYQAERKGSVERLTSSEAEALLEAAYTTSGQRGLMIRTLIETGSRVNAFCQMKVEDIDFEGLEIRVIDKGNKARDIPILKSLAQELRIHVGEKRTGYLFLSQRSGPYSPRRIQQILKELAVQAGITKKVHPHLLRHTIAQRLADSGMPADLLQRFLGHSNPKTTQVYYEPNRANVKRAFKAAMTNTT